MSGLNGFMGHTVGTMVVVAVTCLSCFAVLLRLNGSLAWIYLWAGSFDGDSVFKRKRDEQAGVPVSAGRSKLGYLKESMA